MFNVHDEIEEEWESDIFALSFLSYRRSVVVSRVEEKWELEIKALELKFEIYAQAQPKRVSALCHTHEINYEHIIS